MRTACTSNCMEINEGPSLNGTRCLKLRSSELSPARFIIYICDFFFARSAKKTL
jgi:hypothetical protein